MKDKIRLSKSRQITYFAVLTALTLVLQLVGNTVRIGVVTLNFSLIPIVLCGLLLGVFYGAALGGITGLIILLQNGILGADGFTNVLFATNPVVITLVCLLKTGVAGAVCALIYGALKGKNRYLAVFLAAASVPIINSGLFAVGMFLIIPSLISAGFMQAGDSAFYVVFIGFIGLNFVFEFALNVIVAPALYRVIQVFDKTITAKAARKKQNLEEADKVAPETDEVQALLNDGERVKDESAAEEKGDK